VSGYDGSAATFYDMHYGDVAEKAGRQILDFLERQPPVRGVVIDVCCGTGQMAQLFAQSGFKVVGIDLSEDMLSRARKRTSEGVSFVQGDATDIPFADDQAGVVVCSTDSVNHLNSMADVRKFIQSSARILRQDGWLVMDVLTPKGFADRNGVHVLVNESSSAIVREIYDEECGRSMSRVTAFYLDKSGLYRRMDMNANRLVIDPFELADEVRASGFADVFLSWPESLGNPVGSRDDLRGGGERVYVLARR
jgi:ubiquinone/menaquinone biosynthesis C-methylase UbiE